MVLHDFVALVAAVLRRECTDRTSDEVIMLVFRNGRKGLVIIGQNGDMSGGKPVVGVKDMLRLIY